MCSAHVIHTKARAVPGLSTLLRTKMWVARPFGGLCVCRDNYRNLAGLQICNKNRLVCAVFRLKCFPLVHQVTHLPHEGLVFSDYSFGTSAIFIKGGEGHFGFKRLDALFPAGDATLEVGDPGGPLLGGALAAARLGVGPLLFLIAGR